MRTIFRKELTRTRTGLVIWSVVAGIVALFGMLEYPFISQYLNVLEDALASIPKIGQLVFGVYNADFYTPIGFYIVMYYWTGLIVFTHAIYTGASIISKESRDKTAEYLFTKPYKRNTIVWAKILTGLVNILVVGIVTIIMSLIAMLPITREPSVYGHILVASVGMLFTQCVLMSLGLLCSAIFKTYKSGASGAIIVLIASYCLMFFVQYADMPPLNFLSPLTYFPVAGVVKSSLNIIYILLAVVVVAVCVIFTQRLYSKKEIIM